MKEDPRFKKIDQYLDSFSDEEIEERNQRQAEKDDEDFEGLRSSLAVGKCYYCNHNITDFAKNKPCFHWLLWQAKGLKKKHFPKLFAIKSFHEIDAYLRWVANTKVPFKNINDLVEENTSAKVIETTIKYDNLEWSFSCSQSDFDGHKGRHEGAVPHYHFQMKKEGFVVIGYNDFHVSFLEYDFFFFAIKHGKFKRIAPAYIYGAGMQSAFDDLSPEDVIDHTMNAPDAESATFHMSTILMAEEGKTMAGADLAELFKEHNETGVPLAKLVQKLKNVKAQTLISPGPGVPKIAERSKHNRGKSKETDNSDNAS